MAFESLSTKLQNIFKGLKSKGILKPEDIDSALKEVKMSLLEADVNFKVVKTFISNIKDKTSGEEVLNGLNPAQTVIKIVHDELIDIMGKDSVEFDLNIKNNEPIIIMAIGLQGSGKTTSLSKYAYKLKNEKHNPLMVACDIYRPAAIEQLKVNATKAGVDYFEMGTNNSPITIIEKAITFANENQNDILLLDTAGRTQLDEEMMQELVDINNHFNIKYRILVVDAMTGQEAVNVADAFNSKLNIDGIILTKLDGDSRGGAALSVKEVTGSPIIYCGMGEKLDDLEKFYPDRMASRILGMGDVLSLIEKAEANIDKDKADEITNKVKNANFDFNDFLESMNQISKMGGISSMLKMLPGVGNKIKNVESMIDESRLKNIDAIIKSMTPKERSNPDLVSPSRKNRIANGAGVDISEVNKLYKQFKEASKQMKHFSKSMNSKNMFNMLGKL